MNKFNFEVVIPSFKHGSYLKDCVKSIREADKNVKVTIVFSGINTLPAFLKGYSSIKAVLSQKRLYPAEARNIGFLRTASHWVVFIDSDCILKKDYFKILKRTIEGAQKDDVAITGKIIGVNNSRWAKYEAELEAASGYDYKIGRLTYSRILRGGNFVLKREFFNKIGAFECSLPSSEDREMGARINNLGKRIILKDDLIVLHFYYPSLFKIIKRHVWHSIGNSKLYVRYPEVFKDSFIKRARFALYYDPKKPFLDGLLESAYHLLIGVPYMLFFYILYFKEKLKKEW